MSLSSWISKNVISIESKDDNSKSNDSKIAPPSFSMSQPITNNTSTIIEPATQIQTQSGTVDLQKFRNHVKEVFQKNNQDGPDYYEFNDAVAKNESLNLPKATAFMVAYNSLAAVGLTKNKLLDSGNYYITVLENDFKNFQSDLQKMKVKEITGRENQIATLEQQNQEKALQIQKLTEEMNNNNQQKQQLSLEKMQFDQKFKTSEATMQSVIESEKLKIKNDLEVIQTSILQ